MLRTILALAAAVATVAPVTAKPASAHTSPNCQLATAAFTVAEGQVRKFAYEKIDQITESILTRINRTVVVSHLRHQNQRKNAPVMGVWPGFLGGGDSLEELEQHWVVEPYRTWAGVKALGLQPLNPYAWMKEKKTPPSYGSIYRLVSRIWNQHVRSDKSGEFIRFDLPEFLEGVLGKRRGARLGSGEDFFTRVNSQEKIAGLDPLGARLMVVVAASEYREIVERWRDKRGKVYAACERKADGGS